MIDTQELPPDTHPATVAADDTTETAPDQASETEKDKSQESTGDGYPLTDTGNARRLLHWFGKDLRYCPDWASWLVWDGTCWCKDEQRQIVEFAKQISQKIKDAANRIKDGGTKEEEKAAKPWYAWAHSSQSAPTINAMIKLAESDARVVVRSKNLDKDLCVFNCVTGTIDLQTGRIRAHRREDLITKTSPVAWNCEEPERWLKFLKLITADNQDLIAYIQRCIGYSLTGRTDAKALFISYGGGNNGKTIFHRLLLTLFGPYGMSIAPETIMRKKYSSIPNDIARLKGARFVVTAESNEGSYLNEGLIKSLTGGDEISARFMKGEFFDFIPQFSLWIETNHKPRISGTDDAIWNRLKYIPFNVDIPQTLRQRKEELKKREVVIAELESELPGILHWAVCGAVAWFKDDSLQEPAIVTAVGNEYRKDQDTIGEFLDTCCERQGKTRSTDFYCAYRQWCLVNNEQAISRQSFKDKLKDKGIEKKKTNGDEYFTAVQLRVQSVAMSTPPNDKQQTLPTVESSPQKVM